MSFFAAMDLPRSDKSFVLGLVCWRQLGDLVSATTALGLHRQVDHRITFISEFKKYLFAMVFGIDSKFATAVAFSLCLRLTSLNRKCFSFDRPPSGVELPVYSL